MHTCLALLLARRSVKEGAPVGFCGLVTFLDARSPRCCCRATLAALCGYLPQNLHNCFASFPARHSEEEGAPVGFWGLGIILDARSPRFCCCATLAALYRYLLQNLNICFSPIPARRSVQEGAPVGFGGFVIILDARLPRFCCRAALTAFCRNLPQNLHNCFALLLARRRERRVLQVVFEV